jgi:CBS-domain-containing membrane protein
MTRTRTGRDSNAQNAGPTGVQYSLAVGLTFFIMVAIDTEHPPAAGTALGVVLNGFSLNASIGVLISAIILSLIHHFARPYLKDLV